MKKGILGTAILASVLSAGAMAEGIKPVIVAGLTFGGDKIAEFQYTDGTSESMSAGGVLYFGGGAVFQVPDLPVEVQATVNYHFDTLSAENGDASFTRIPLEAIGFYQINSEFKVGAGLGYHTGVEYDLDVDGVSSSTVELDNSLATIIEAGWNLPNSSMSVGARYTSITYTGDGIPDVDGSHFGLNAGFSF